MINIKDIVKRLYMRFELIWGEKHTSRFVDQKYIEMWVEDWCDGLRGIDLQSMKAAIDHCKMSLEWPPSLAEFIKICESYSPIQIPSPEECMRLGVDKRFTHPIVKTIYDKITSWHFSHDTEKDLLKKIKEIHAQEITKFRMNRSKIIEHDTQGCEHGHEQQRVSEHWFTDMRTTEKHLLQ